MTDWTAWLGKRVRAFWGDGSVAAEGEVVGMIREPTLVIRKPDGTDYHHATSLPVEEIVTPAPPDCPFCERIGRSDVWGTADPRVVTFEPLNPVVPGHRLFVPIEHVASAVAAPDFAGATVRVAAEWASTRGDDCNLITSCGPAATQTVEHLHVHVVPRRAGDGLPLPWTPQQTGGDGIDWRSVVDRTSAVAVGAGAPDDGATLPEQVEWLAQQLHGPSLRPKFAVVPDHVVDRYGNVWRVVRDGGMLTRADFHGVQSIGAVTGEAQHGPMRPVYRGVDG